MSTGSANAAQSGGGTVTKARFERFLKAQLSGKSPLGGSIAGSIPIDPPEFKACIAAMEANNSKNKTTKVPAAQLKESCNSQYQQTREAVEGQLITYEWLRADAKQRSASVTPAEVNQLLMQYINGLNTTAKARHAARIRFNSALRDSGLEAADLKSQLAAQILQQKISAAVVKKAGDPAKLKPSDMQRIQAELANSIQKRWRAATLCAKGFTVPQCSNGPKLPDLQLPKQG